MISQMDAVQLCLVHEQVKKKNWQRLCSLLQIYDPFVVFCFCQHINLFRQDRA